MPKMPVITIKIKHDRNVHEVSLDASQPATVFKDAVYQKTGVPSERQKIMVKGGLLKDDTDLAKLGFKPGQTIMVIGTAGELPKAPSGPVTFIEDMTDTQLAEATKTKVGLTNLGNTCYLNSTLQVMRAIPELQVALGQFGGTMGGPDGEANLTASLRDLYKNLGETTEPFPPFAFLAILRQIAPQFAERQAEGGGYAQQDAEEAWVRIVTALQSSLKGLSSTITAAEQSSQAASSKRFVEQYLTGDMLVKRSTAEAPEEEATSSHEPFSILQCNISVTTNDMSQGIKDSLNQQIEKTSQTLGRTAVYDEARRINRLPAYLTTHFVRFYWRREIRKKTKIMRKVRFPFDLDVTDFLSDELKAKTQPYRDRLIEISKEREERWRIRRKAKAKKEEALKSDAAASADPADSNVSAVAGLEAPRPADPMSVDPSEERVNAPTEGEGATATLGNVVTEEEEVKIRQKETAELEKLIHPDIKADVGANPSGLYELVGVVTHKGTAADGGHYISWTLKEDEEKDASGAANQKLVDSSREEWYKFDDDKVTTVGKDKIMGLDGGGQDSTAYMLLYRSKKI